jgi:hypothetical protein
MITALDGHARPGEPPSPDPSDHRDRAMTAHLPQTDTPRRRRERTDGRELTLPCCNVFRLPDGLVADYRVYVDIGPVYE